MRLYHLGRPPFVVGDMTAPPLGPGGLGVARGAGAGVVLFTTAESSPLAAWADVVVRIAAQAIEGGPASKQLMGSIYEQALWVLCDAIVDQLVAERRVLRGSKHRMDDMEEREMTFRKG